ncbi:hypothetical protein LCGC14_0310930 [marine sediment metagenome]|uniref:Uncharacterized protein n=1 Tax=marine sediment metagenome TaxID=412755 RepID=A0A0F9TMD4_9ZZZZ
MSPGTAEVNRPPTVEDRISQIRTALIEAHNILDEVVPRDDKQPVEGEPNLGILSGIISCQDRLDELLTRLRDVANTVGRVK